MSQVSRLSLRRFLSTRRKKFVHEQHANKAARSAKRKMQRLSRRRNRA